MLRRPLLILAGLMLALGGAPFAQNTAPPNEPAQVELTGDPIRIRYNGSLIFDGRIGNPTALRDARPVVVRTGDAVDQAIAFHASGRGGPLEISGKVTASQEAFPCESDRAVRALPVVRHSSGLSRSLLNQAVYDRQWDWVLSVDDQPRTQVRVIPETDAKEWFVRDAAGNVASGNWINHPLDASVPAALDTLVRPIYRELRMMGWAYICSK
jgi:hypothetical protein